MITVIVPAYGREDELRKSLYSLVAQTSDNFKVLISDDCSPNPIEPQLHEFDTLLNYKCIRTPQNLGCGGNRHFALDWFYNNDPTEYLMFMDSDDALMPHAITRLDEAITHNKADIISSSILQEFSGPEPRIIKPDNKTWLHGKIYRTQFLMEHNIQFSDKLRSNEDLAFNLSIWAYHQTISAYDINELLYFWRQGKDSVTRPTKDMTPLYKCNSTDYIDAIYYAYLYYEDKPLTPLMVSNILNCYTYYQNAKVYGYLESRHKKELNEMLHHPQVGELIVTLYKYPQADFKLKQWCVKGQDMFFFGQSFGVWLMEFYTQAEIRDLIIKYNPDNK